MTTRTVTEVRRRSIICSWFPWKLRRKSYFTKIRKEAELIGVQPITSLTAQFNTTALASWSNRMRKSLEMASSASSSPPLPWSSTWTVQVTAPGLRSSAPPYGRLFSFFLWASEMKGNFPEGSMGVLVVWRSARSRRYSWRVRVAMARNLYDLCAAFSALMTLASRKSRNTDDLGKVTPSGMGGPNEGTSLERVTATLQGGGRGKEAGGGRRKH
ncbi:hypothetical protein EYF80_042867 [Liparis tanakae]|uniref:Uncharacterized protein n=1 Tax=Liparis tanakae TaxID=230148 RepID=A0A4Z2G106_9TELE|nr:hypothetical protein EYF80_042867 [Liparis tanakae]